MCSFVKRGRSKLGSYDDRFPNYTIVVQFLLITIVKLPIEPEYHCVILFTKQTQLHSSYFIHDNFSS